jgi:aminoglycoside/choline kinase family phosphotransferase
MHEPGTSTAASSADRAARAAAFLAAAGVGSWRSETLPSDASFRRYRRLHAPDGTTRLLMDAPPEHEKPALFAALSAHLIALGLSAPAVFAADLADGFLLLEDFGEDTFTRLLRAGAEEAALYRGAVAVLAHLHGAADAPRVAVGPYDRTVLQQEAGLLLAWFLPLARGRPASEGETAAFTAALDRVFDELPPATPTLVLRDYHVDNLMRLPGREGLRAWGLLDFQDALLGPAAYDLVSLLEDARRDVPPALVAEALAHYAAARGPALEEGFNAWYAALGAQRHAKVLGIFVRLAWRDGKPVYLAHLPRVWRLFAAALEKPALAPLKPLIEKLLPEGAAAAAALSDPAETARRIAAFGLPPA